METMPMTILSLVLMRRNGDRGGDRDLLHVRQLLKVPEFAGNFYVHYICNAFGIIATHPALARSIC